MMLLPLRVACACKAQRLRNGRGGMPGVKAVVFAFRTPWKARKAAVGAQRIEGCIASREQLMRIGLMTHVKDDFIAGRFKNAVQRLRYFYGNRAQIRFSNQAELGGSRVEIDLPAGEEDDEQ